MGKPIRQNPLDIWTIQELIVEQDIDVVLECGTLDGGSAYFMATLFDLLGRGSVVTVDTQARARPEHPRIQYLAGSSVDPSVVAEARDLALRRQSARILVVLDSDHAADHVLQELRAYADLVPVGSYLVVQDGVVDELRVFKRWRPGPLVAIAQFVAENPDFEVDERRSSKFLFHYSPRGCLRRIR